MPSCTDTWMALASTSALRFRASRHAPKLPEIVIRGVALEVPVHFAAQGQPPAFHLQLHPPPGDQDVAVQPVGRAPGDVRVVVDVGGEAHLQLLSDTPDALDAPHGLLGLVLLKVARHVARQGHDPVLDGHPDVGRVDARLEVEFVDHVLPKFLVLHRSSPESRESPKRGLEDGARRAASP